MNHSRRSFFGLFAASGAVAVAAPALAERPALSHNKLRPTVERAVESARRNYAAPWHVPLAPEPERRVILRSLRLLGVLDAMQNPSAVAYDTAAIALNQMLDDWYAKGRQFPTEREVTYSLALEIAPEYMSAGYMRSEIVAELARAI